jgi:hypothetical protein
VVAGSVVETTSEVSGVVEVVEVEEESGEEDIDERVDDESVVAGLVSAGERQSEKREERT